MLRLGTYELAFSPVVPAPVVINEAVELDKKYDDAKARAFVNGVQLEGIGWDTYGSGAYFLVWAVAAWVAGVVVLQRRDA